MPFAPSCRPAPPAGCPNPPASCPLAAPPCSLRPVSGGRRVSMMKHTAFVRHTGHMGGPGFVQGLDRPAHPRRTYLFPLNAPVPSSSLTRTGRRIASSVPRIGMIQICRHPEARVSDGEHEEGAWCRGRRSHWCRFIVGRSRSNLVRLKRYGVLRKLRPAVIFTR